MRVLDKQRVPAQAPVVFKHTFQQESAVHRQRRISEPATIPIPAAQYVRMSDETQEYSILNQKAAIQEYAASHNFEVVKTYADAGKSGVIASNRAGLKELLKDVVGGNPCYKAILVYDVSRWGRFPNNDEAAHYEFLCSSSGIPLHYCAEQFANDGTASSSLLKALKRSMAAEFSRELGEKVFRGKSRLVRLGFWVGGAAGLGYRRMMVSGSGVLKQILKAGEHKSLTTDRIVLVLGPPREIELVREMFSMAISGLGCTAIARDLNNRKKVKPNGKLWGCRDISNIVTNPKYAGCNVWYRGTQPMRGKRSLVESQLWVKKEGAFPAIVDCKIFNQAQAALPKRADTYWSDKEIVRKLRRLLSTKGYLSESLIVKTAGMPATTTLRSHFGNYKRLYDAVGYQFLAQDNYRGRSAEPSMRLRRNLMKRLSALFAGHVNVKTLPYSTRSILEIDHTFMVSVLLCVSYKRPECRRCWIVVPRRREIQNITLLCKLNPARNRIASFHLLPRIDISGRTHRSSGNDPLLKTGVMLRNLSTFYSTVKALKKNRV